MRKLWLSGVCVALMTVAFVAIASDRSGADVSCDDREVCLWENANFQGCFADEEDTNGNWEKYSQWDNCSGSPDRKVSSYRSRWPGWILFYENTRADGRILCIAPFASGNVPREFNDRWRAHSIGNHDRCAATDND